VSFNSAWLTSSKAALLCTSVLLFQQCCINAHADVTTSGDCSSDYDQCLESWKKRRVAFLKSETGYLNLAGLFWLKEGSNTFGSDASNDIVFPARADASIGTFKLHDQKVSMLVDRGIDVRIGDEIVSNVFLPDDTSGMSVVVRHGNLAWTLIKRDSQFAIRLRDFESPILQSFSPIDYYPIDTNLRVTAELHRYQEPRIINVGTVIEGLSYNPQSPGVVRFEIDGELFELEAYDAAGQLFFVFGDRTSGRETYPAGRFLYAEAPGRDGKFVLDFNTAQNPPCAFNEFATCPIASPRNRLPIRIEAGERFDASSH
jgi:uncharacterized protein (DUF1684 family)